MITIRNAADRGHTVIGWLDSWHTFSFGGYQDHRFMGFRSLRVINDDRVAPGEGFGEHGHRDMEIFTYVLEGGLEHRDSLGNGSIIRPGDVQVMSAGTGIRHSEFNPSDSEVGHFLQIWVLPEQSGLPPRYAEKHFDDGLLRDQLRLIASRDGRDGSTVIVQDAAIYAGRLSAGRKVTHEVPAGRHGWVQVARGAVVFNGIDMVEGDGAAIDGPEPLTIEGRKDCEVLLFDLA